jgi:hypothetical protein
MSPTRNELWRLFAKIRKIYCQPLLFIDNEQTAVFNFSYVSPDAGADSTDFMI